MKKDELRGWQKVFSFTVVQNYRSKSALVGLIVVCLLVILSGPVFTLVAGSAAADKLAELGDCKIENFYLRNDTDYDFDTAEFSKEYTAYSKINYIETDESLEEIQEKFEDGALKDIILHIHRDDEKYYMSFYKAKGSEIGTLDVGVLSECADEFFFESRMKQAGVSDDSVQLINSEAEAAVVDISDISDDKKDDEQNVFIMMAVTVYACVIMMIVLVSSQQIAVSLITEKSSKVIETLMLSVRPLAIIVGKITGMMVVLVINFTAFMISGCISGIITSVLAAKKFSEVMTSGLERVVTGEFSPSAEMTAVPEISISPGRIIFGLFAIVFTTILAYLFYSVMSGISGASCSSMEDLQGASTFISLTTVIGVYTVMGAAMTNNAIVTKIAYLFPFSGIYMVPIHYLFGNASVADLLIVWAEIIVLTVIMFRFAAKIYHVLMYHKGERLKFKNLIEISKSQKGQG